MKKFCWVSQWWWCSPLPAVHGGTTAGEIVQQVMGGLTYNATRAVRGLNLGNAADALKKGSSRK